MEKKTVTFQSRTLSVCLLMRKDKIKKLSSIGFKGACDRAAEDKSSLMETM